MNSKSFPLEKIFGSRTRVKIITLFTTGVKRPYYVREISRNVNERLNAVRRELDILRKIGMLTTHDNKRRKYYVLNHNFFLIDELASIMQKAGPGVEDTLFKNMERLGDLKYACVSGYFTGAKESPTDILLVGSLNEERLANFIKRIEDQLDQEITYTPMTENEYRYRLNFNDLFLRNIFGHPYKELINKFDQRLDPVNLTKKQPAVSVPFAK
ncbi:MAG: winged helix-turn-helix domain-containing protein [bacterium]|nr:winged helix-turn-helix domain-containing protein [bacterium]